MLANHSLPFGTQEDLELFGSSQSMSAMSSTSMPTREAKLFAMLRKNRSRVGNDN